MSAEAVPVGTWLLCVSGKPVPWHAAHVLLCVAIAFCTVGLAESWQMLHVEWIVVRFVPVWHVAQESSRPGTSCTEMWSSELWQSAHTSDGVVLPPWHAAQPGPPVTPWIAATSLSPGWQPQPGEAASVWLASIGPWNAFMVPAAVTWQPACWHAKVPDVTVEAGLGWHFVQELAPPWIVCSSSEVWHSVQSWLPYGTVLMVMTAAVTVDVWLAWFVLADGYVVWHVTQTSDGVLPVPWQAAQPGPPVTPWIAATSLPPVWQPVAMQLGVVATVWIAVTLPWNAFMFPAAVTWQPACWQAKVPEVTVDAGDG
jgi:hypothetical protein